MSITVELDMRGFRVKARQMGIFAERELPFAIANTINDTLFQDTRPEIIGPTWSAAFTVRNRALPSASMRIKKASKGDLSGEIYDALGKAHLKQHAVGGSLSPSKGHLAIPNRARVKLHARGKTPWAREIKVRPHMARGHLVPSMQVIKGKGIFVGEGGHLRLVYSFAKGARLRKRFKFYETFARKTVEGMERRFPAHIQRAIGSAFGR